MDEPTREQITDAVIRVEAVIRQLGRLDGTNPQMAEAAIAAVVGSPTPELDVLLLGQSAANLMTVYALRATEGESLTDVEVDDLKVRYGLHIVEAVGQRLIDGYGLD